MRRGKGQKDRRVMLPDAVRKALEEHLEKVRRLHHADLAAGFGRVALPGALEVKYPSAPTDWSWQFVFPAGRQTPLQAVRIIASWRERSTPILVSRSNRFVMN